MAKEEVKIEQPTKAEEIWNKIKEYNLDLFGLPGQTVEKHCKRNPELEVVFPDTLHLTIKSAAVYPSLEDCLVKIKLGKNESFEVGQYTKYTTVKIITKF